MAGLAFGFGDSTAEFEANSSTASHTRNASIPPTVSAVTTALRSLRPIAGSQCFCTD